MMLLTVLALADFTKAVLQVGPSDVDAVLKGVSSVITPGLPGGVAALDGRAIPFLVGKEGKARFSVGVMGQLGSSRVAAFGHGGYISTEAAKDAGTRQLLLNLLTWLNHGKAPKVIGSLGRPLPAGLAESLGMEPTILKKNDPSSWDRAEIIIVSEAEAIDQLRLMNKGLLISATPWGWLQLNPGKSLDKEFGWNQVLDAAGIAFCDGTVSKVQPMASAEAATWNGAEALKRILDGKPQDGVDADLVLQSLRATPEGGSLWQRLSKYPELSRNVVGPSMSHPISATDAKQRLGVAVQMMNFRKGKPVQIQADFPGSAPASEPRRSITSRIPLREAQWVSVGAYANPNEEVTVDVPASIADRGLAVQIGVHSDSTWHVNKWTRYPELIVSATIKSTKTKLTSPFGGIIVIRVPRRMQGSADVTITGATISPRFVLGETTNEQWQAQLKSQTPWSELQGKHLILSVPTTEARKVADPKKLMELWDKTLELYSDLDGAPDKPRPERIVPDREISAGYMHSGYPIMTWMDKSVPLSLNYDELVTTGTWGHWHELGHNRQKPTWTFAGTGEVTNNIFTLLGMTHIAKATLFERVQSSKKETDAFFAAGAPHEQWQSKPFVALTMYAELIDAFGWDSLKKVFRTYLDEPKLPNDQAKRDQWMIRYSKVVGRNLVPFFTEWGFPLSDSAKESVKSMPEFKRKAQSGR